MVNTMLAGLAFAILSVFALENIEPNFNCEIYKYILIQDVL